MGISTCMPFVSIESEYSTVILFLPVSVYSCLALCAIYEPQTLYVYIFTGNDLFSRSFAGSELSLCEHHNKRTGQADDAFTNTDCYANCCCIPMTRLPFTIMIIITFGVNCREEVLH